MAAVIALRFVFVATLALCSSVQAADGGTSAPSLKSSFDVVVAEAHDILSRPYENKTNHALQPKLLACVQAEPGRAECWKLLATVYARAGKDETDKAKAREAYLRYFQLDTEEPQGLIRQQPPWVDYPWPPDPRRR